jgi:DNA phosphorothioation-dependent restriction protein DptH
MTTRTTMLADLVIEHIRDAQPGHCLRIDDLAHEEAADLREAVVKQLAAGNQSLPVKIHVLGSEGGDGGISIEEAVGLRNDVGLPGMDSAVLILLVPPSFAREASSLDNSFERVAYAEVLEQAAQLVIDRIRLSRNDFPANELLRLTRNRLAIEHWLQFLESVEESPDEPFGQFLWQIGLVPDGGDDESVKGRLRDNDAFVRKIIDPAGAGHAVEDRLRQTRLAPGPDFDNVLNELVDHEDHLDNARDWTKAVAEKVGLPFDQFSLNKSEVDSDLEGLEVQPFRTAAGTVPRTSGLVLIDENLVCEIPDDSPGRVKVSWRTTPAQTKQVSRWLLRVVHPEDLREDSETALVETRVAGSRRSATIKLDFESGDITGGFLFVVEVLPLDADGHPLELPDSAITESEAFELNFKDSAQSPELAKSSSTAHSLAVARLRAVSKGASSLEEAHPLWDWNRNIFTLRIGGTRNVQIPASLTTANLQRQIIANPAITAYEARSPYGLPLTPDQFLALNDVLPTTLAKKRKQVMELLAAAEPRDLPEVFPWNAEARETVSDYLLTYKRALDAAEGETLSALQRLDTVELSLGGTDSTDAADVTVILAINPIRLAWLASYDELTRTWCNHIMERGATAADRKNLVDFDALARLAPTNIPFSVATRKGRLNVYFDELSFGTAILLPVGHDAPDVLASTISTVFNTPRYSASMSSDSRMIADRLVEYRKAHPSPRALRIASMHPGDAAVLAESVAGFFKEIKDDRLRLDVIAYGDVDRYAQPLQPLTDLQRKREEQLGASSVSDTANEVTLNGLQATNPSPLFPPIGASLRPLDKIPLDNESVHVAVAFGVSDLSAADTPPDALDRFASLDDLLCPIVTTNLPESDNTWAISPALTPRSATSNANLVAAHRSHQDAAGKALSMQGPPAIRVDVAGDTLDNVRVLHERSDWVLTLDRFVGLNFYESGPFRQGTTNYILDYAPDFIEGMSHRLTVTTSHRAEVNSILKYAMSDLGLDALDASSSQILDDLMTVSGRLILRLQSSEGFARESVSLAALISHLRGQNKLDGAIIVPVDSHHEIFGRNALGNDTGRRCDMLIVRISQRKFTIQCVEVKSRRSAALPIELADNIVDQLETTRDLLEQRYFASDPPRIDSALQRAQLAGLLHYYADRAVTNGLISPDKVALTHKHIDSLVEGGVDVEITMQGYVISLSGAEGIPAEHRGIPISVLTATDLGKLGFSIKLPSSPLDEQAEKKARPEAAKELTNFGNSTAGESHSVAEPAETNSQSSVSGGETPVITPRRSAITTGSKSQPQQRTSDSGDEVEAHTSSSPSSRPGAQGVEVAVGKDSAGAVVMWKPSTKGSPHAFIVGIPGQGKSVTTRRLISELADHGLPSLVIDFHGDMAADPPANAEVLSADSGLPFTPFESVSSKDAAKVNRIAWELAEVIQFVGSMKEIQRSNVYKALQEVYQTASTENRVPTLTEFAEALEATEARARGAGNARERVRPLTDFGLFDESASRSFNPREAGMVVDLSKLMLEEVQIAATSFLLRQVYRDMFSWPQDGTLKLAIVLDEAHRVANDVTLPKLMKEGRKYGVVVVVASQGLSDFHKDVLGNAGMKIVFRTNHPESKNVARYLRGRAGQDLSVEIEKLGVGQAYVATPDMTQARKTQMFE